MASLSTRTFLGGTWKSGAPGSNLSYADTAGIKLAEALRPGVLRYPAGTPSNVFNISSGRYVSSLPPGHWNGYDGALWFMEQENTFPNGTFSGASFLSGLGGKANRTIWVLNVFTMTSAQTCDTIQYIAGLPGQQADGVLLELGNELYIRNQGMPKYPGGKEYGEAMIPIVACARQLMPKAKLGAVGAPGRWNEELAPYAHLFDGLSFHDYSPNTEMVNSLASETDRISYVAAYSCAAAITDVQKQQASLGGVLKPIWMTEFGYGLDGGRTPGGTPCILPTMIYGAVHGAFHASRILAAIEHPGIFGALTMESFADEDPEDRRAPDHPRTDWCGMMVTTAMPAYPNQPSKARVTGTAQLVSHFTARALAMETMHPVNFSNNPALQFTVLGQPQPCLQGAAFKNAESTVIAILNVCNTTVPITLPNGIGNTAPTAPTATVYSLNDPGYKAPLPVEPAAFPWAEPLTHTRHVEIASVYTAAPLTFTIVEA